ncbi:MAG: membrane protein insertase YidC, partial [Verrucomicrobiota bacterium]
MKNLDRTSWIGILVCLLLLFAWGWWSSKEAAKNAERDRIAREAAAAEAAERAAAEPEDAEAPDATPENAGDEATADSSVAASTVVIENEYIRLHFTNIGAGIDYAELLKHDAELDGEEPISINQSGEHPIGALTTGPGEFDTTVWTVVSSDRESIAFQTKNDEGLTLTKSFRLAGSETSSEVEADPYTIDFDLTIRNDSGVVLEPRGRYLYTGTAQPLHLHEWSIQIGMFWRENGDFEYKTVDHYGGRKILGIFGKNEIPHDTFTLSQLDWGGVNDQFFATIIKPDTPYPADLWGDRLPVVVEDDPVKSREKRMFAAEGGLGIPQSTMNPGDQSTLGYEIYIGPKEFSRLKALGEERQEVMHYDEIPILGWMLGWAIKPLASLLIIALVAIQGWVGSYGIAIILTTVAIRLLIWPIYAKSARSMKRMSKLAPKMKEIREKYEDDPQTMNQKTMALYKDYGVNPLGSCLPLFIQMPVFLAFYRMLWSAVELRHESFLWVDDLSMPDTLFNLPFELPVLGSGFNLLPILMGITSFVQIAMTPSTGDKTQRMIFMLMPVIFLVICYNFASALALYWTVSNLFTILQTWIMNKL